MGTQEENEAANSAAADSWLEANGIEAPEEPEVKPEAPAKEPAKETPGEEKPKETGEEVKPESPNKGGNVIEKGGEAKPGETKAGGEVNPTTEDKGGEKPNLASFLKDEAEKVVVTKPEPFSDEMYSFEDDQLILKDKRLVDDVLEIDKNPNLIHRFVNSKKGHMNAKGDFIAENILGYKPDASRSAGKVASDTIRAYNDLLEEGKEAEAEAFAEEHIPDLPDWIPEGKAEDSIISQLPEDDGEGRDDDSPSLEDIKKGISNFVEENFNEGDREDAEKIIMDDPEVYEKVSKPRFDPETGKELTIDQKLDFFLKEEGDDFISVGGNKNTPTPKVTAKKEEEMTPEEKEADKVADNFIKNNL